MEHAGSKGKSSHLTLNDSDRRRDGDEDGSLDSSRASEAMQFAAEQEENSFSNLAQWK